MYQWQMVDEDINDDSMIGEWLSRDFEPFAISGDRVYLKQHVWVEPTDKELSSARQETEQQPTSE